MFTREKLILVCYLVVLLFSGLGYTVTEIRNATQAIKYLIQFGYFTPTTMDPNMIHKIKRESVKDAIIDFQTFSGLPTTGELDSDTFKMMNIPRCGCIDRFYRTRFKRYGHFLETWRVDNLTYRIVKYPSANLNKVQTDLEFRRAFDDWSSIMPIDFNERSSGPVRIEISFISGEHGDFMPFDGPQGVLSHNLSPGRGTVHFDDSENWTIGTNRGINLHQVALHAIGHILGLDHSLENNAVMRPFYKPYSQGFKLQKDDIQGAQAMYGPRVSLDEDYDNTEEKFGNNDIYLCSNPKIDTIFNSNAGETFLFKGNYYWKLKKNELSFGYPKYINQTWKGLPAQIDSAFTHKNNGYTYFFQNTKYWKYFDTKMLDGYPKDISKGFTGIPNKIDAVLPFNEDKNVIYFFKGTHYWVYNDAETPPVANTYPKRIYDLLGLTDSIDDILYYSDGYVYVFKDNDFYKYSDFSFGVYNSIPPVPQKIAKNWYGCNL